jgi:DDE superfamily endonuclease
LAFDEARFGLINWHRRRRYCPMGFRPPYTVKRSYKWTYLLYAAAVEPTTGESFCLYLPGMDDECLEVFLDELSKGYPEHHLLVVLDGAPSHRSEQIAHPENISLLMLPPYSPEH